MSGKEESLTQSRLKEFEQELDAMLANIGITFIQNPEVIDALQLTYEQLKNIVSEEALILACQLQQYALYIQSVYNRLDSIKGWAEHNLSVVVGKEGRNYGTDYTKYEEKRAYVINENSYAKALAKILLSSSSKAKELNHMSNKIEKYSYILLELSKRKTRD